eukprot:scaffold13741_cov96-Isochrysis_galbana.AAC.3
MLALTKPISRKSELWCRKYFHSDLISYTAWAARCFRLYVHTSSSGEIAAAGTRVSSQKESSPPSAAPTNTGDRPALRAKWSQFLTKSIMTAEPNVKCSVVGVGPWDGGDDDRWRTACWLKTSCEPPGCRKPGTPPTPAPTDDAGGGGAVPPTTGGADDGEADAVGRGARCACDFAEPSSVAYKTTVCSWALRPRPPLALVRARLPRKRSAGRTRTSTRASGTPIERHPLTMARYRLQLQASAPPRAAVQQERYLPFTEEIKQLQTLLTLQQTTRTAEDTP